MRGKYVRHRVAFFVCIALYRKGRMNLIFATVARFLVLQTISATTADLLTVSTTGGKIEGVWVNHDKCRAFLGVPFAQPPLTELRFRPPAEATRWGNDTVLQTKKRANICISMPSNVEISEENEDCLYLNIVTGPDWKAKPKKKQRPVMVYIHGGGFIAARSGFTPEAACENFVSRDVVVVSIQYRVGYLGFLATGDEAAVGNYGLLDQIAALKWISENIKNFGGNPKLVTVFGSSAGGASASLLSYTQEARQYMTRVISQSGSPFAYWAFNERSAVSFVRLVDAVDCKRPGATAERTVDCLRRKPIHELQEAHFKTFGAESYAKRPKHFKTKKDKFHGGGQDILDILSFSWSPRIDGHLFTKPLSQITLQPLPTITGVTNDECLVFAKPWLYWRWLWEKVVGGNLPVDGVTQFWVDDDEEEFFEEQTLSDAVNVAASIYQYPYMHHPDRLLESADAFKVLGRQQA